MSATVFVGEWIQKLLQVHGFFRTNHGATSPAGRENAVGGVGARTAAGFRKVDR